MDTDCLCVGEGVCHSLTQGKKQLSKKKKKIQPGVVTPDYTPSTGQVEVEGYLSFVCQVVCKWQLKNLNSQFQSALEALSLQLKEKAMGGGGW